jgi:L-ascorbate metabolism protein UlaG (beta-lactamase superfamily)
VRRKGLSALAVLALLGAALGKHLGWFRAPVRWEQATGWDRLDGSEIPAATLGAALGPDAPAIGWLGHSGFRIVWGGTTVLLDPNTSAWCTVSRRLLEAAVDPAALGPVDAVLISHAHFDHLDLPTLRSLGRVGVVLLPAGDEELVAGAGVTAEDVRPLRAGARARVGDLEITAVRAAHSGSRLHPFRARTAALGYVIRRGAGAIYYSGDTGFSLDFAEIGREHRPQVAILPIGAFAPRVPMRFYHLSPEEAVEAGRLLGADLVIPCHFGTFALSLDSPDSALPRFARAAAAHGLLWTMPRLLVGR